LMTALVSTTGVLQGLWQTLSSFHCKGVCPHTSCLLSVVRGFRNGVIYGAKIRAPHAFVMTFLFYPGSIREKLTYILQATYEHSRNLGMFVALYKTFVCILRHMRQKESGLNSLLAGAVGGWFMFGEESPVNSQINMYILSRVTLGMVRTAVRHNWVTSFKHAYPLYAAVCWALVMYLYQFQQGTLQKSLVSSMTYLYTDSNSWPTNASDVFDWFMR